jgi:hypothetical protein
MPVEAQSQVVIINQIKPLWVIKSNMYILIQAKMYILKLTFTQYSYVPKPLILLGLFNIPLNKTSINNQYSSNIFIFFLVFLSQPFSSLYYGKTLFQLRKKGEKTGGKQAQKRPILIRKTSKMGVP